MPQDRCTAVEDLGMPQHLLPGLLQSPQTAATLGAEWLAADLHVHTCCSPDVLPLEQNTPEALLARGRALGLGYVSFTDHMTMAAYDRVGWERQGLIRGVEISLLDRRHIGHTIHLNVYLPDQRQFREILDISTKAGNLELLLEYLSMQDLPHTYNHPFWFEPGEQPNLRLIPEIARLFPVLEYNRGRVRSLNLLTVELARRQGKALAACSDAHTADNLGRARTYARGDSARVFLDNIRRGKTLLMTSDLTVPSLTHDVNAWIRMVFSQQWRQDLTGVFSIGEPKLDWFLNACTHGRLSGSRRLMGALRRLVSALSSSGIPQTLYIRSQQSIAQEIERQLLAA